MSNGKVSFSDFSQASFSDGKRLESATVPLNNVLQNELRSPQSLEHHVNPSVSASFSISAFSSPAASSSIGIPPSSDTQNQKEMFSTMWSSQHKIAKDSHRASFRSAKKSKAGLPSTILQIENEERKAGNYSFGASSSSRNPYFSSLTTELAASPRSIEEVVAEPPLQQLNNPPRVSGDESEEIGADSVEKNITKKTELPCMVSSLSLPNQPASSRPQVAQELCKISSFCKPSRCTQFPMEPSSLDSLEEKQISKSTDPLCMPSTYLNNGPDFFSISSSPSSRNVCVDNVEQSNGLHAGGKSAERLCSSSAPAVIRREKALPSPSGDIKSSHSQEKMEKEREDAPSGSPKNSDESANNSSTSLHAERFLSAVHPLSPPLTPRGSSASTQSTVVSVMTNSTGVVTTPPKKSFGSNEKCRRIERSSSLTLPAKLMETAFSTFSSEKKLESEKEENPGKTFSSTSSTESSLSTSAVQLIKSITELPSSVRCNLQSHGSNMDENEASKPAAVASSQSLSREQGEKKKGTKAVGTALVNPSVPFHGTSSHHSLPSSSSASSSAPLTHEFSRDGNALPQPLVPLPPQHHPPPSSPNAKDASPQSYASSIPLLSHSSTSGSIGRTNAYMQTDPTPFCNVAIGPCLGVGEGQSDPAGVFLGPQYSTAWPLEALPATSSVNMPHQVSQTIPSSMPFQNPVLATGGGRSNYNRSALPLSNPFTLSVPSSSCVTGGGGGTAPIDSLLIQVSEMSFIELLQVYVDCCLNTSEDDNKAKRQVFEDVQAVVKSQFGIKADAHIYGSVITNLALSNSDIDLLVTGYHPCSPLETIQALSAALLEVDEEKLLAIKNGNMQAPGAAESSSQGEDNDGKKSIGEDSERSAEIKASSSTENVESKAAHANDASEGDKHPMLRGTSTTNSAQIFSHSTHSSVIQDGSPAVSPFLSMSSLLQSDMENIVHQEEGFVNSNASSEKEQYSLPEELETAEEVYRNQIEKDYTFSTIGDYSTLWQSSRSTAISASTTLSKGTNTAEVTPAPVVPLMAKIATAEKYRGELTIDYRADRTNERKASFSTTLPAPTTSSSSSSATATTSTSLPNSDVSHVLRTSAKGSNSDAPSGDFEKENPAPERMKTAEERKKQRRDDQTLFPENTSSNDSGKGKGSSWCNPETLPSFGGAFGTTSSINKTATLNNNNHISSAGPSHAGIPSYYTFVPTVDGPLYRVQTITSARIPVIKITNKTTNQRADITFGGGEHFRSLQMTKTLLDVFPPSRDLIRFIKHCVARMGIGELTPGGITSFTIYLMVRHLYNILLNYIARRCHEIEVSMMEAPFPHYCSESGTRNSNGMRWSGVDASPPNPHISSMMASSLYAENPSLPSSSAVGETCRSLAPPSMNFGGIASPPLPLSPSVMDEVDMFVSMYCKKFGRFQRHQHPSPKVQQKERPYQQGSALVGGAPSTSSDMVDSALVMPSTDGEVNLVSASTEENCSRSVGLHGRLPSSASYPSLPISEKEGRKGEGSEVGREMGESSVSETTEIPFSSSYSAEVEHGRDVEREGRERDERRSKNRCSDCGSSGRRTATPFFAQDSVQNDDNLYMGGNGTVLTRHRSGSSQKETQKDEESNHPYSPVSLSPSPNTRSPQQEESSGSALLPFPVHSSTPAISSTADGGYVLSLSEPTKTGLLPTALSRCSSSSSSSSPYTGDKDADKLLVDTELPIHEEDPEVSAMIHYEIAAMIIRNHVSFTTILRDFCAYYGCVFNYETQGIRFSPNGSSEVVPKPFLCSRRGQLFHMTSPFDPGYDITARMTCMRDFQWMCEYFSSVVIPSFSFYTFLMWLHPPSANTDLYAVRNYFFLTPHLETAAVSASSEWGTETGERDVYPGTEIPKKRGPSPQSHPKALPNESFGSVGEEGGMRQPDTGSSFYFKKSHSHKDRIQTPPPGERSREGLHLPSGEGQCSPLRTSEEASMRQQLPSSQRSHPPKQKVPAESSPYNTTSHPSTSTRKINSPGEKNRLNADGKRKMMSGKGIDGALSPPSVVTFSSVHAGGNCQQVFPSSPPPPPASLASAPSPPPVNHGEGKNYMASISSAASVPGGGATSHLPPPALSSLPNGFLPIASHPSTAINGGGVSNMSAPSAMNGLLFLPSTHSYSIPISPSTGGVGHESYAPNSRMTNGNVFPRYLYTGGERGGGSNFPSPSFLMPRSADSMSSMSPPHNVYVSHGGVNGRGIGEGLPSGGNGVGSFPIFPGGYAQYYEPMIAGNQTGNPSGVVSNTTCGNAEMMMPMNAHPHHMNTNFSNGTTAAVGASMIPSPGGVTMAFHMGNVGMMPGGLPLSSATPCSGTNGTGVPSNTTNVSSNTNNGNSTTMMPVFGSPSTVAYNFAAPHGSNSAIADDIGHRPSHPPHSHPHNSSKTHFPPPPPPPLSAAQQLHNGILNNNGGSALSSGGSSSSSNGSSGSKVNHNALGNSFFGPATNFHFSSHVNQHHNSHDPSAGGKGGGGPSFPGYHLQQYPSFPIGEFQPVNGGRASGGGQKSSSTSAMRGGSDDNSVYSPPAKPKGKAKGEKHNEEASPHSESTPLAVGKEKMSEKRFKTDSVLSSTKIKPQEYESSGFRAQSQTTLLEEEKSEKKQSSLVLGKESPCFPPESGSPPRESLTNSTNGS